MTKARDIADLIGTGGKVNNSKLNQLTLNGVALSLGDTANIGLTWVEKNTDFDAEANKAYAIDTSAMGVTATLPSNPSQGDEIRFLDATGSFDTYGLAVLRNGKKIMGSVDDLSVTTNRAGFSLVFFDDNEGWLLTEK